MEVTIRIEKGYRIALIPYSHGSASDMGFDTGGHIQYLTTYFPTKEEADEKLTAYTQAYGSYGSVHVHPFYHIDGLDATELMKVLHIRFF